MGATSVTTPGTSAPTRAPGPEMTRLFQPFLCVHTLCVKWHLTGWGGTGAPLRPRGALSAGAKRPLLPSQETFKHIPHSLLDKIWKDIRHFTGVSFIEKKLLKSFDSYNVSGKFTFMEVHSPRTW